MTWVMKSMADCLKDIAAEEAKMDASSMDCEMDLCEDTSFFEDGGFSPHNSMFEHVELVANKLEKYIFQNEADWLRDFHPTNLRCVRGGLESKESHQPGTFYVDGRFEPDTDIHADTEIAAIFELLPVPFVHTQRSESAHSISYSLCWKDDDGFWKIIEMTKSAHPTGGENDEDVYFYIADSSRDLFMMAYPHIGTKDKEQIIQQLK